MKIAIIQDDLVAGFGGDDLDGVPVPGELRELPRQALRWDGESLVDVRGVVNWFVDGRGRKHIAQDEAGTRQPLACAWDARLAREDGQWRVVGAAEQLAALKARLAREVDAAAEAVRLGVITPGAGQAMVYQEKAVEAERLQAALAADPQHQPDPAGYPILAASLGIEGEGLGEIAALVLATKDRWRQIAAAIEAARLGGKAAIAAADSESAARAARQAVAWPELG